MKQLKKILAIVLILSLLVTIAAGCTQTVSDDVTPVDTDTTQTPDAAPSPSTRIFTDLQGNEVELPLEINKVIHLWPASTALQVFLGSGDKIIGTLGAVQSGWGWLTSACPKLLEVPGFTGDATAEELLAYEPDVVITSNKDVADTLRAQGVPVVCMLAGEDMDSLKKMILSMGELLGPEEAAKANEYINYLNDTMNMVESAVASIPEEERVVVYYNSAQHGDSPLLTCGDGSIVESWMLATGCINAVAGQVEGMDKEVNMEVIIEADPDWIVVGGTSQEIAWNTIMADPAWQNLTAVKEGRIIRNPQGVMKWEKFGVEIALQMYWFTEQVYPGALNVDIEATVKDFYSNYYGYDLSDKAYADLIAGLSSPQQ